MSRSVWKEPFSLAKNQQLAFSNLKQDLKQEKTIQVWSRNAILLPKHIGKNIQIYNGKNWVFRKVIESMVGHKFGEFCSTKRKTVHKTNKTKGIARKK